MINQSALSVSQLNTYVKMLFESDNLLHKICVVGEISNFVNHYKTGHLYFSLKDNNSAVKAVMFSTVAKFLKFKPENGMRVYLTGRVSVFERDGVYQIYVDSMEPEGAGALMIAFEQLKSKLASEGLFDENNKKKLPEFPSKIGVITSPVGAAVQDVINILSRRYPLAEMILCPVAAQGVNCAKENINAIKKFNELNCVDVIILCRGGGSIEDLWGYNDEQLVRTVASSEIPVITGIGHETDFTLCDFASDFRAPTPSAAVEISVPDIYEQKQISDLLIYRLDKAIYNILKSEQENLESLNQRLLVVDPRRVLEMRLEQTHNLKLRLISAVNGNLKQNSAELNVLSEKLRLLNPLYMLQKGYAAVTKDGKRIKKASSLKAEDTVKLTFGDGNVQCLVKNTELTVNQ